MTEVVESAKKLKTEKRKKFFRKHKNENTAGRGAIVLKNIPHGFYEEEMKAYFSQFGKVTRLRLLRSKKTGNSKGTAFIEFEFEAVAKVVAEAMHNYLMFDCLLKCEVLPEEKRAKTVWFTHKIFDKGGKEFRKKYNESDTPLATKRRVDKLALLKKRLAALGVKLSITIPGAEALETKEEVLVSVSEMNEKEPVSTEELQFKENVVENDGVRSSKRARLTRGDSVKLMRLNMQVKSGAKAPKSVVKTPKLEAKTPKSVMKTPKFMAKTPKSAAKTPKSDVKTPRLSLKTPKSIVKTPTVKLDKFAVKTASTEKKVEKSKSAAKLVRSTTKQLGETLGLRKSQRNLKV